MQWDAIVLAGGRGSRLGGVDKASLELDGATLLSRVLEAVAGATQIVVVGEADAPGAIVVQEEPRFAGPAAAVGSGLAEVTSPYVLLAGVDQPFLADAIPVLLDAVTGDGVIAVDAVGHRQQLMSVISADALRQAVAAQSSLTDLSLRALLSPLDLVEVAVSIRSTLDIDTWNDRDRALEYGQNGDRDD
ncbi:molybdopterin-guanine dinucleotide biosynthesis protein A [Aeromicrobium panaciterrae]|uniref:Molybdopterin-guanine dinucleotide biosynthesis protein A n=1 Tax=Aeromicrobium panaciterrae TaxID=363861 RepID=A0ABU1ULQ6_9ACTN|nr:NTP transferase domain-containing protein [Aeromicrobium panaciterrae]MDR7086114.1 molybdopterin-guanine dinucleotide biosynthesis protein A [Aeromicrobium panaciterrae]